MVYFEGLLQFTSTSVVSSFSSNNATTTEKLRKATAAAGPRCGGETTEAVAKAFAEIYFVEIAGEKTGVDTGVRVYLAYKLHRCMVKSWSTSGDADDLVMRYYALLSAENQDQLQSLRRRMNRRMEDYEVAVAAGDTAETLAARVFEAECIAYPEAIRKWRAERG